MEIREENLRAEPIATDAYLAVVIATLVGRVAARRG